MARVICAISGIELKVQHVPMVLNHRELAHPIFYLNQKTLLGFYARYNTPESLNDLDSFLLFLALLNSTDQVKFEDPVIYNGRRSAKMVANHIHDLVTVIWETDSIWHPTFKQPSFRVRASNDTTNLSQVGDWITSWRKNIDLFKLRPMIRKQRESIKKAEEKLDSILHSGIKGTKLASVVANWADKAGEFPLDKRELWMKTIRKCYNPSAMFVVAKSLLLEIKEYCELNIEADSVHFHTLYSTLLQGIKHHSEYLDLDNMASVPSDYTLLPDNADNNTIALTSILENAPKSEPTRTEYPSDLAFLRAKLRYRVYLHHLKVSKKPDTNDVSIEIKGEQIDV